jgi:hypothetical protein
VRFLDVNKDSFSLLFEKLSKKITETEDLALLKQVLEWYVEGGSKMIKTNLDSQIAIILQGWDE